jgi:gluconolactonase
MVEPNSPGSDSAAIKNAIGICFAIVLVSCVAGFFGQASGEIIRLDQKLDEIVSSDARVEKLAGGFGFVEGPVWDRRGGYLLFSDIPANVINTWTPDGKVSVLVKPSGFTGTDPSDVGSQNNNGKEVVTLIGSNGLTLDRQGRIVLAAHGDRAIVRILRTCRPGLFVGRSSRPIRFVNEVVGTVEPFSYFTDPPYGLRKGDDDPKKELPFSGVYLLKDRKLQLLDRSFTRPNGLAFSPRGEVLLR